MKRTLMLDASSIGLLAAVALAYKKGSRASAAPARSRAQKAVADERSERQRWNDEVDARKAAKKSKQKATP